MKVKAAAKINLMLDILKRLDIEDNGRYENHFYVITNFQ